MIIRDDIPIGYTRDANGRILTCKDSDGYWCEYTYDPNGRVLTFKNSYGRWYERTRDAGGRVLTHKQEGFSGTRIADDSEYVLFRDTEKDLFLAGCQGPFTRAKALEHWDRGDERAKLFTKAIREAV